MEVKTTRQEILWVCFDEISVCGDEVKFITSNNEETFIKMNMLNFFSPLFSKMLGEIPLIHLSSHVTVVNLPSVKKTTLTKLCDLLNYGVTASYSDISHDDLEDVKAAAQMLGIRGFSEFSVNISKVAATEVFPREILPFPLPLDYSVKGESEEERLEVEEENFAEYLHQLNNSKNDDLKTGESKDFSQASSVVETKNQLSFIPDEYIPEYSPTYIPEYSPTKFQFSPTYIPEYSPTKFQFESYVCPEPNGQDIAQMLESVEKNADEAVLQVKKDHIVEKEKPQDRRRSHSSERGRLGGKRKRGLEKVERQSENRGSRGRGGSRSCRGFDSAGDVTRGRRRVLLPRPVQDLRVSGGPPISSLPELQYIYDNKYHKLCGKTHRRIDLCDLAPGQS